MKRKHLLPALLLFFLGMNGLKAQLPDGSIAPDWTLTDLNGVTHNLYTYLDAGKTVVIDFSATWCGPCWNYHNNGTLETLWDLYGPDGTDEIMVFFLEGDMGTNDACLYGDVANCTGTTQGNWVAGTGYPIINIPPSQGGVVGAYQISYWPTLYVVCAENKKTYEAGQTSVTGWEQWIFESCALDATWLTEDALCGDNGSVDLTTIAGFGNLSFDWSNGASTEDIDGIPADFYSVTITDAHGHSIEVEDIEVGGTNLVMSVGLVDIDPNLCFGESDASVSVTANNGQAPFAYVWDTGDVGATLNGVPAGEYYVTITDANQCEATESFVVTDPPEVGVSVIPIHTTCGQEDGELHLEGFGGTGNGYLFDVGSGYTSQAHFYELAYGWYDISVMDANGCENSVSEFIEPSVAPFADAGEDQVLDCETTSVQLDGTASNTGGQLDYYWSTVDGNIVGGTNSLTPVVDAPGTYTLTVFDVYDDCEDYDEVIVTSMAGVPNLSVAVPEVLTCSQELVTLDASGSDEGADFVIDWTTADGNIIEGENTLTPVVNQPGIYTLSILNLTNGCLGEMSVTVDADYSVPSFTTSDGMLTCTVSEVDICVSPQNPGDVVIWEDGFEGLCRTVSNAGTYSFMVFGLNGCSAAGETLVTMDENVPVSSAGEDRLLTCTTPDVTLDGSSSSAGEQFSYQWQDADGNVLGNEVTLNVSSPGVYTLMVTNLDNGCSSQDEVLVDEFINTADPDFTTDLDYNILTLLSTSQNPDEVSTWTSSDGQIATGFEAQFIYMEGGEYEICHAVTNECGTETACQTVSVTILPLTFEGEVEHITCPGGQDGKIAVTPAGGIADYLVTWTGPEGFTAESFELSELAAGSYTMQLSDAAGTMVEELFELVQPAAFEAQYEVTDEIDGNANGAIEMTISGGTPPYTFAWSNGMTTEDIVNLAAGDYLLVVTDNNGCEFTVTITVDLRTGLIDVPSVALFIVRPNPTFNDLQVDLSFTERPQGRLILLDQLGQVIETRLLHEMNQEENFTLEDLKAGIYFIRLELPDVTLVRKAVKL